MPRLPDFTALGQTPVPSASTRVPGRSGYETAPAAALADIGESMQDIALTIERVQERQDKYAAEDAYNKLIAKKLELTAGEDGFIHKRGEAAAKGDLIKTYDDRMGEVITTISSELSNPRQQKYFNDRAAIARNQNKQDILSHVVRETDAYMKDVYASTIATETQNAASRYSNVNDVNASAVRINSAIAREGERLGWPKEKVKQIQYEAGSNMHIGVIQMAVSEKNSGYARSWFEVNKKNIDPDKHASIERLIKTADLTELGQCSSC